MSRSRHQSPGRKRSSCACGRCSGFKAQPRALTVEGDLAAIDHLHWTEAQDIGEADWDKDFWWLECPCCNDDFVKGARMDSLACVWFSDRAPLRAPLAEIARAA